MWVGKIQSYGKLPDSADFRVASSKTGWHCPMFVALNMHKKSMMSLSSTVYKMESLVSIWRNHECEDFSQRLSLLTFKVEPFPLLTKTGSGYSPPAQYCSSTSSSCFVFDDSLRAPFDALPIEPISVELSMAHTMEMISKWESDSAGIPRILRR